MQLLLNGQVERPRILQSTPTTFPSNAPDDANIERKLAFIAHSKLEDCLSHVLFNRELNEKLYHRFKRCGTNAWVEHSHSTDRYRVRSNACKLRLCPRCQRAAAAKISERISEFLGEIRKNQWKMITLTLRHSDDDLRNQLARLRLCFRRLRQRKLWKANVIRGYAVIEITYNGKERQWHPHLHVLAECKYIPHSSLMSEWHAVTSDSMIVWIQKVPNRGRAVKYIADYLGKPPDTDQFPNPYEAISEWHFALKGAKLVIRFGDVPSVLTASSPSDPGPSDWRRVARIHELLSQARAGSRSAAAVLKASGACQFNILPQQFLNLIPHERRTEPCP